MRLTTEPRMTVGASVLVMLVISLAAWVAVYFAALAAVTKIVQVIFPH